MNVFAETKHRLTMYEVARFYGLKANRSGFVRCPFHRDKTASMKLYPGDRGFHCFGCGKGGSVIDFVSELYGLDPLGAVRRLNEDFHLALPVDRPPTQAERVEAQKQENVALIYRLFESWRNATIKELNAVFRVAHLIRIDTWDELTDGEALALREQAHTEFLSDKLSNGTPAEQMEIFRERREIKAWTDKVLRPMPMK